MIWNGPGRLWTTPLSPGPFHCERSGLPCQPAWASGTAGNDGADLVVQNDGNVVIHSASGAALWATGTSGK